MPIQGFEHAFREAQRLVAIFQANYDHFTSAAYQEAEVRNDFINAFFIALGWDVTHQEQTNPFEQEVKVEPPVATGMAQRRADYAFYIEPNFRDPRLIVEAKKPHGTIATADNYFQAIRYAWNKQNPVAGLTDFEHFHLLDCRFKPNIDTAISQHVERFHFQDYTDREKFARLYWLVSREAVGADSLEKYAAELPKPQGKAPRRGLFPGAYKGIDDAFLEDLDGYRLALARAFKSRNPDLDGETLTETTQRTLDRLVFMRFLEDKLIEPAHFVARFGQHGTAWHDFIAESRRLNGIYNGIVFKRHGILDSTGFQLDDHAFAGICGDLSHQNSPYDFNSIPIHILGSIYERFLGNVIVATEKRVRIELKPELRKNEGVYYTPDFVVSYIVENTVGKLVEGKTPEQIAQMRFADISCGSGSFLIAVYDLLLRYHLRFYSENPRKVAKGECETKDGVLHLSVEKKREILLNNIYGVDIDHQAVEVTQLSLYLKLLDEETIASARGYQLKIHAAILPPLDRNIVCGNSLIGRNIASERLFDEEEERKLNPMDFKDAFPEVTSRRGFDAIVGNPPWGAEFRAVEKRFLDKAYTLNSGKYESYVYFVEAASHLLRQGGRFGMILPSYWISRSQTAALRRHLLTYIAPETFLVLPDNVFRGVKMDACIYTGTKGGSGGKAAIAEIGVGELAACEKPGYLARRLTKVPVSEWTATPRAAFNPRISAHDLPIIRKIERGAEPLDNFIELTQGLTLYRRSTLAKEFGIKRADEIVKKREFHANRKKNKTYKKELLGKDVERYFVEWNAESWVSYGPWLAHAVDERFFQGPRIVVQKIRNPSLKQRLVAGYLDDNETYSAGVLLNGIRRPNSAISLFFVLALLNSKLLNFWYRKCILDVSIRVVDLEQLPIPPLDVSKASDKKKHDVLVTLVQAILGAKEKIHSAKSDRDMGFYGNQCASLDRQIDEAVYKLYGLTDEEIRVIEGGSPHGPPNYDTPTLKTQLKPKATPKHRQKMIGDE